MSAEYLLVIIGVLFIVFAFWISTTSDFMSRLVFNIFPFFSGCYIVVYAVAQLGWITIG